MGKWFRLVRKRRLIERHFIEQKMCRVRNPKRKVNAPDTTQKFKFERFEQRTRDGAKRVQRSATLKRRVKAPGTTQEFNFFCYLNQAKSRRFWVPKINTSNPSNSIQTSFILNIPLTLFHFSLSLFIIS